MSTLQYSRVNSRTGGLLILFLLLGVFGCGEGSTATPISQGGPLSIWYVATTGIDTPDCHSVDNPCLTVQWVVDHAVDGDEIHIADGVYVGRIVIGDLDIEITGSGTNTILENPYTGGPKLNGGVIALECDHCYSSVSISDLTVRKSIGLDGGGIFVNNVDLTLENVWITDTSAENNGGCISISPLTNVVIGQVILDNCVAVDSGGGIYNEGNLTISNSMFQNNQAENGGGLFNYISAEASITMSEIISNTADNAGGIYNKGNMTILTSTIKSNIADNSPALINASNTLMTITTSTINENIGLIPVQNKGNLTLSNVTISGNIGHMGSVLLSFGPAASIYVSSVTIANNTGIGFMQYFGGQVFFHNTIIANNSVQNCNTEIQLFLGQNNLSSDTSCAFFGSGSQIGVDPLLGPLADNGGTTWTHTLLSGSPAIDNGAGWELPDIFSQPIDQRGVQRPQDGNGDGNAGFDIGAFELAPAGTLMMTELLQETPLQPPALFTPADESSCYASADVISPLVETLPPGVTWLVDGRNEVGDWVRLWKASAYPCWVPAIAGLLNVDPSTLAVLPVPIFTIVPTITVSPVPSVSLSFGIPELSTHAFEYQRDCVPDPSEVNIKVTLSSPPSRTRVYIFFRLRNLTSGELTAWNEGLLMEDLGSGIYGTTVSWSDIPDISSLAGSTTEFHYQFIAIDVSGAILLRSPVYTDATVSPCD